MEDYINITSDGGVVKKITKEGTAGKTPSKGKEVTVNYVGKFQNGKVFDQSDNGFAFLLGAGEVIKGWDLGVASMNLGEKATFVLKPDYAYGSRGAGKVIPPNSTLVFDVELLKI
jgi:FKBP-type peptidyl-prolyl cis-trans isomerase